jgi:hypothetical protein
MPLVPPVMIVILPSNRAMNFPLQKESLCDSGFDGNAALPTTLAARQKQNQ